MGNPDEGIEDILADALKRMEAQIADARVWKTGLEEELQAAADCLRGAEAHAAKLREMLEDPYLIGKERAAARIDVQPVESVEIRQELTDSAERQPPPALAAPVPEPELPPVVQRWKQKVAGDKRLPNPALTTEQLEERNQGVMKVLPDLWAKGGRVLAGDVMDATGYGTAIVYRAMKLLEDRGDIRIEKVPLRPGDKRVCNAILPSVPIPVPKPPKLKREDKSVLGILERMWASGDVNRLGRNYPEKQLLTDCTNMATSGRVLRVRDRDGTIYLLPPEDAPQLASQEKPALPAPSAAPEPQKPAFRALPKPDSVSNGAAKSYVAPADPVDLSLVGRENAVMGALEEMWRAGDATMATLTHRLVWEITLTRKVCWALKEKGELRIRHLTGRTYLLPKPGAPLPSNSLFDVSGNP